MDGIDDLEAGKAAWQRLRECQRKSWDDWLAVGRALVIGRSAAMTAANTNRAVGTKYNRAMTAWLAQNDLDDIAAQERYRILLILENLAAIEGWRAGLDHVKRRRLNHPNAIWAHWRQATAAPKAPAEDVKRPLDKPADTAPRPLPRASGKAIHWPAEVLQRAATAIHEARSIDSVVLARKALEAAIRSDGDLLALFPQPSRNASPQRIAAVAA